MVGGWFIGNRHSNSRTYGNSSSTGTTLTTGAANTKGAYTTLIASTVGDASAVIVTVLNDATASNSMFVDIAVGAAASEQVIISNVMLDGAILINSTQIFPVAIPSGTRISARAQTTGATNSVRVMVMVLDDGMIGRAGSVVDSIGALTATTIGTSVDAGASANTKGAYAQIIASTAVDYGAFCFHMDSLGRSAVGTSNNQLIDVAVGGAGSEQVIISNYPMALQNGNTVGCAWSPWFEMDIPSGTRIAVRSQASSNVTPSRTWGFIMHGLRV